jgi:hypothetical protein
MTSIIVGQEVDYAECFWHLLGQEADNAAIGHGLELDQDTNRASRSSSQACKERRI